MPTPLSRRQVLAGAGAALAGAGAIGAAAPSETRAAEPKTAPPSFRFCLNTSTIRGQKLSLIEEIETTAKAGYSGIEPWISKIRQHAESGGSLKDVKKRLVDLNLTVESAIGFARWIVDDDAQRAKGLEEARRDMDLLAQIGGVRIAAPPAGATREGGLDLFRAAERYRKLLEIGDSLGVTPQVEIWGPSKNLSRLGEAAFVAIEAGHPKACVMPDVYHVYKGGSDFAGLGLLSAAAVQVMHMNDYPADPPRETIGDRDRVYPGDGVAPLSKILRTLAGAGCRPVLSLELFNPTYWKDDALTVAKTGLEKMKAAVAKTFA